VVIGMTYDKMLDELATAGWPTPSVTLDGIEALRIERANMPEHLKRKPVTGGMLPALMAALAPIIRQYVASEIEKATAPLAAKIMELEQRPAPKWRGVFTHGAVYQPLEFVVDRGALWVAKIETNTRPGSNDYWQLCCKSGSHNGR
jgi:hypothetical protein